MEKLLEDVIGSRPRFSPTAISTSGPHVVLVLDGVDLKGSTQLEDGIDGVTVLDLDETPPRLLDRSLLVLDVRAVRGGQRELHTYGMDHAADVGTPDRLSAAEAEAVARRLAPLRLAAMSKSADTPLAAELGLGDLLGIADPEDVQRGPELAARPQPGQTPCAHRHGSRRWCDRAGPQGVRTGRHGTARAAHRRHRVRQVRVCCARWCWRWRRRTRRRR
jgi:S-DNA-T family DNA segregation ATPase FtsK/SpoIIIE